MCVCAFFTVWLQFFWAFGFGFRVFRTIWIAFCFFLDNKGLCISYVTLEMWRIYADITLKCRSTKLVEHFTRDGKPGQLLICVCYLHNICKSTMWSTQISIPQPLDSHGYIVHCNDVVVYMLDAGFTPQSAPTILGNNTCQRLQPYKESSTKKWIRDDMNDHLHKFIDAEI
jgi:hypothetical protein